MDLFNSFTGESLAPLEAERLCLQPYTFMVCCAFGAQSCTRGGRYHLEVTLNDEAVMVAQYVYVMSYMTMF